MTSHNWFSYYSLIFYIWLSYPLHFVWMGLQSIELTATSPTTSQGAAPEADESISRKTEQVVLSFMIHFHQILKNDVISLKLYKITSNHFHESHFRSNAQSRLRWICAYRTYHLWNRIGSQVHWTDADWTTSVKYDLRSLKLQRISANQSVITSR